MPHPEPDRKPRRTIPPRTRPRPMYANVVERDGHRLYSSFSTDLKMLVQLAETWNRGVIAIEEAHAGKPPVWVREEGKTMSAIQGHEEWLATIIKHYGSIREFDDATTVRNMRRIMQADIDYLDRIFERSKDNEFALQELHEMFDADRAKMVGYLAEMDEWLAEKGLTT